MCVLVLKSTHGRKSSAFTFPMQLQNLKINKCMKFTNVLNYNNYNKSKIYLLLIKTTRDDCIIRCVCIRVLNFYFYMILL